MGVASPVGLGEQDGRVGLADEVFISHFADSDHLFFSAGHGLQGQGGLYFWPQHAQVRRQHVDEDLRGKLESRENYVLICCEYREQKKMEITEVKIPNNVYFLHSKHWETEGYRYLFPLSVNSLLALLDLHCLPGKKNVLVWIPVS